MQKSNDSDSFTDKVVKTENKVDVLEVLQMARDYGFRWKSDNYIDLDDENLGSSSNLSASDFSAITLTYNPNEETIYGVSLKRFVQIGGFWQSDTTKGELLKWLENITGNEMQYILPRL